MLPKVCPRSEASVSLSTSSGPGGSGRGQCGLGGRGGVVSVSGLQPRGLCLRAGKSVTRHPVTLKDCLLPVCDF